MQVQEFISKLNQRAAEKGLKEFEIRYSAGETMNIEVLNQEVLKNVHKSLQSLNFAVCINKKRGKVEIQKFDLEQVDSIIDSAIENAKMLEIDEEFFLYDGKDDYPDVEAFSYQEQKFLDLDKISFLKMVEKRAYELDEKIEKVTSANINYAKNEYIMLNSKGLNLQHNYTFANASVSMKAKDGERSRFGGERVIFDKDEDFDPETLAAKAVAKVVKKCGAVDVQSGKTAVVFENKCFASFLAAIEGIFSAYQAETGHSKLKGKTGEIIAAEKVTIIDNPWMKNGMGSISFDGDGVPTKITEIIKNGRLMTMLYNLSMASKHGVKTTANGAGGLGTKVFNCYLENGDITKDELLKKVGNGVYVTEYFGLKTGISSVSGDFSIGGEGFLLENGKITKPLNLFTISGNIYQLLKDISLIADDLLFDCSKYGSPTVAVGEGLTISGK